MARTKVSTGVELEYDTFGDDQAPTMVLVMGFSLQLTGWDPRFCGALAARGYRVVRFDNRDVGKSTHWSHAGIPDFMRALGGDRSVAAYGIEDMADDVAAFIPALGVPSAHVVGVSMGGFIAQEAAIRHSGRIASVTSIMSSTGDRRVGQAKPEALAVAMAPAPQEREEAIAHSLAIWRVIGSPGFPLDEERQRRRSAEAFDRDHDAAGVARQAVAIVTQRDRTEDLRKLRVPFGVIHGESDPLIDVSGGQATAAAVPGARLHVVPGMGHDLPEALWPTFIDAIVDNARRAVA
jgi:pimeloyl-ACP methyl ester carboxylesterase